MFKNVKDHITDEVNSAAKKIQELEIQNEVSSHVNNKGPSSPTQIHFSLIDDGSVLKYRIEDELNSDSSPQDQLFNESLIKNPTRGSIDENGTNSPVNNDNSKTSATSQPFNKSTLLAKLKETIKSKNSQIETLREALEKVNEFKIFSEEMKQELNELRRAHESWTLSIAENKLVVHQEIELKNAELAELKRDIDVLHGMLSDSNNQNVQLKTRIQDLESRLVKTSAAHQMERDNLTREMTIVKNSAIKQIQKEHELKLERVKLDLEKSIEALKIGLLTKDQQLMEDAKQIQSLTKQNRELQDNLEQGNKELELRSKELEELKKDKETQVKIFIDSTTMTDSDSEKDPMRDVEHEYLKNIGK